MTPFRLPWCQNKFLFGVYFLSCSHFDQKTFKAKKCYHGHRSTFNSNHLSVIYMHSHSLLQDQIHFWILSLFFVFCFSFLPWQYLPVLELCFHCFIAFMSFQSFCLYLCSCRELLLMMHAWFSWACSLLLSDLTRQHQLSDEQRRKSKCECVDGDRDHYLWWPQAVWGQYTRIVHITNAKFCNLEDWVLKAGL